MLQGITRGHKFRSSVVSKNWKTSAVVWINDELLGSVIVGSYGFVFWERDGVVFSPFSCKKKAIAAAFMHYNSWADTRKFDESTPRSAVMRFVRTGLFPPG